MSAAALDPFRLKQLCDEKGHFDRLLGIEPWIAVRMVTIAQIGFRYRSGAADTFGDILSSHFEMHTTGVSALRPMD